MTTAATQSLLQACGMPGQKKELPALAARLESQARALQVVGLDGVKADVCAQVRRMRESLRVDYAALDEDDRNFVYQVHRDYLQHARAVLGAAILYRLQRVPLTPDKLVAMAPAFELSPGEVAAWDVREAQENFHRRGQAFLNERYGVSDPSEGIILDVRELRSLPLGRYLCRQWAPPRISGCPQPTGAR